MKCYATMKYFGPPSPDKQTDGLTTDGQAYTYRSFNFIRRDMKIISDYPICNTLQFMNFVNGFSFIL